MADAVRLPTPLVLIVLKLSGALLTSLISVILFTVVFTRLRYIYQLRRFRLYSSEKSKHHTQTPPKLPYNIPLLGNALSFLAPKPGLFWKRTFAKYPRSNGALTLMLGGTNTHIIFDPTAVQALFKARKPHRDRFTQQILTKALGAPLQDVSKAYGNIELDLVDEKTGKRPTGNSKQHDIWNDYLVKTESVNELTREFITRLRGCLDADSNLSTEGDLEVGISSWLRKHMFRASTDALCGTRLLEIYPELEDDYWAFDYAFLSLFFGLPKSMLRKEYEIREKCLGGIQKWHAEMRKETIGQPLDPRGGVSWEPCYGARVMRARHQFYNELGLRETTRAAADLGVMFGLSSNAIPTAAWMLLHILDPKGDATLHRRLVEELRTARKDNGTLDISKLIGLPLLQAIFQEVLRLYVDVLVTRDLPEDIVLPFDDGKRSMYFKNGTTIMAPSWISQRYDEYWTKTGDQSPEVFYPERFLKTDPGTGIPIFTLDGSSGKLFPFGGGKTICPGRVFAKQEVLGAVAMVLLEFEIESVGYIDAAGKTVEIFPGLKDAYLGAGAVAMDGDLKVRIKRRS